MKYLILICSLLSSVPTFAADCKVVDSKTRKTIMRFGTSMEPVNFSYAGKAVSVVFVENSRDEYPFLINATLNEGTETEVQVDSASKTLPMLLNLTFGENIAHWLMIDCK